MLVEAAPALVQEHVPHQRVAVGVQPARGHRDHHVTGTHPAGPEELAGLHDSRGRARDVVLVRVEEPGVLGGLAADEPAPGSDAGLGDALDDGSDPLGYDAPGGDVVGEEQRLGAADDEVVDEHARRGRSRSCRACRGPGRWRPWCRRRRRRSPAAAGRRTSGRWRRRARRTHRSRRSSPGDAPGRPRPSSARRRGRRPRSRPRPLRTSPRSGSSRSCHRLFDRAQGRPSASPAPPPASEAVSPSASSRGAISSRCLPRNSGSGSFTG